MAPYEEKLSWTETKGSFSPPAIVIVRSASYHCLKMKESTISRRLWGNVFPAEKIIAHDLVHLADDLKPLQTKKAHKRAEADDVNCNETS